MRLFVFIFFVGACFAQSNRSSRTAPQISEGAYSPNISNVTGNVTITYACYVGGEISSFNRASSIDLTSVSGLFSGGISASGLTFADPTKTTDAFAIHAIGYSPTTSFSITGLTDTNISAPGLTFADPTKTTDPFAIYAIDFREPVIRQAVSDDSVLK